MLIFQEVARILNHILIYLDIYILTIFLILILENLEKLSKLLFLLYYLFIMGSFKSIQIFIQNNQVNLKFITIIASILELLNFSFFQNNQLY